MISPGFLTPKGSSPAPAPYPASQAVAARGSNPDKSFSSVLDTLQSRSDPGASVETDGTDRDEPRDPSDDLQSDVADGEPTSASSDGGDQTAQSSQENPVPEQAADATDIPKDASGDGSRTTADPPNMSMVLSRTDSASGQARSDNANARRNDETTGILSSASNIGSQKESARVSAANGSEPGAVGNPIAGMRSILSSATRAPLDPYVADPTMTSGKKTVSTKVEVSRVQNPQATSIEDVPPRDPSIAAQRAGAGGTSDTQVSGIRFMQNGAAPINQTMQPTSGATVSKAAMDAPVTVGASGSDLAALRASSAAIPDLSYGNTGAIRPAPANATNPMTPAQAVGAALIQAQGRSVAASEAGRAESRSLLLEDRIPSSPAIPQTASASAVQMTLASGFPSVAATTAVPALFTAQSGPMPHGEESAFFETGSAKSEIGALSGANQSSTILGQVIRPVQGAAVPPSLQIAQAVGTRKSGVIEVSLSPEELGTVRISIQRGDGAMQVAIFAERDETMSLLRRHIEDLDAAFKELDLGQVDISFEQEERQNERASSPANTDQERSAFPPVNEGQPQKDPRSALRAALGGRLDLKL